MESPFITPITFTWASILRFYVAVNMFYINTLVVVSVNLKKDNSIWQNLLGGTNINCKLRFNINFEFYMNTRVQVIVSNHK